MGPEAYRRDILLDDEVFRELYKCLPNSAASLLHSFPFSERYKTMIGMPYIIVGLVRHIYRNTIIYKDSINDNFKFYVIKNILDILKSDNFRNRNISVEYIYYLVNRFSTIAKDCTKGVICFKSADLLFNILCNSNLSFYEDDLNMICDSLGDTIKMSLNIGNALVRIVKKNDEDTNREFVNYIGEYKKFLENNDNQFDIFNLFFILCKNYMEKSITRDRLESVTGLVNKFYNEYISSNKSAEEIKPYALYFTEIIESKNFKKGLIPDTYLEEHFKCYYEEQLRTIKNLLTCEYYEEGFITEKHIKLVSNDKDYIFITCMLDCILTGAIPVEGNKYDVVLGILNFDRKKELCNELYSYLKDDADIEEFKSVAFNYLQYYLFFPKFDVKPFAKKRVPENDN